MRDGVSLAHSEGGESLVTHSGRGRKVMVNIHSHDHVGLEHRCYHPTPKPSDLLIGRNREQAPHIVLLPALFLGHQPRHLLGHKTSKPVVQVRPCERVWHESWTDGPVHDDRIPGPDPKLLDLVLLITMHVKFQVQLFLLDADFTTTELRAGKVDGPNGLNSSTLISPVGSRVRRILAEEQHLVAKTKRCGKDDERWVRGSLVG